VLSLFWKKMFLSATKVFSQRTILRLGLALEIVRAFEAGARLIDWTRVYLDVIFDFDEDDDDDLRPPYDDTCRTLDPRVIKIKQLHPGYCFVQFERNTGVVFVEEGRVKEVQKLLKWFFRGPVLYKRYGKLHNMVQSKTEGKYSVGDFVKELEKCLKRERRSKYQGSSSREFWEQRFPGKSSVSVQHFTDAVFEAVTAWKLAYRKGALRFFHEIVITRCVAIMLSLKQSGLYSKDVCFQIVREVLLMEGALSSLLIFYVGSAKGHFSSGLFLLAGNSNSVSLEWFQGFFTQCFGRVCEWDFPWLCTNIDLFSHIRWFRPPQQEDDVSIRFSKKMDGSFVLTVGNSECRCVRREEDGLYSAIGSDNGFETMEWLVLYYITKFKNADAVNCISRSEQFLARRAFYFSSSGPIFERVKKMCPRTNTQKLILTKLPEAFKSYLLQFCTSEQDGQLVDLIFAEFLRGGWGGTKDAFAHFLADFNLRWHYELQWIRDVGELCRVKKMTLLTPLPGLAGGFYIGSAEKGELIAYVPYSNHYYLVNDPKSPRFERLVDLLQHFGK
jgi:hypothetical protein